MTKKTDGKLTLRRESLRRLSDRDLQAAEGGNSIIISITVSIVLTLDDDQGDNVPLTSTVKKPPKKDKA